MKKFLANIILLVIGLLEKYEYRNLDLDENDISKKIIETFELDGVNVLTDTGYEKMTYLHISQPYTIWKIKTNNGKKIECADIHKVYDKDFNKVCVKDLNLGDFIQTVDGSEWIVSIEKYSTKVSMGDVTVDHPNHRLYTNGILSAQTICSSIYIAWYVLFNFDRNVLVLSNKGETTKEIVDKAKTILDNLPFFLKPGTLKNDVFNLKYDNGCRIIAQSTTKKAGIGFTIHLLFLDEFAHIHANFIDSFYENVFPVISSSKISRVIITSTPGGFNKFYEIYEGAVKKTNEFNYFRVDWWQVPGRDKEWMRKEIENLGSIQAFNRQYGNQFMSSGNLLLNPEHIKKLDENMTLYTTHVFPELDDIEIEYDRFLTWHPNFDTDETTNQNNFWVFSVDVAEGGRADHSIINIFKLRLLKKEEFSDINNPGTFSDFFGLDQVAIFRSNEHNIDQFSKILYVLAYDIFYSENVKIVLEWNSYGGELLKCLSTVFPQRNDFGEEMIVKFKHRNDATTLKHGLRIKTDNKPILCQKFKKAFHENRIMFYDPDTVEESKSFGKMPTGVYKATRGHDDCVMTCINAAEFLDTVDYHDFVEEMYDNVDDETTKTIENEIELSIKGDGTVNYDIYDILWTEEDKKKSVLDDLKKRPEDEITFDFL